MTRSLGIILAVATFGLDRLMKWWVLGGLALDDRGTIPLLPFFDLSMVWNRGISLGLFQFSSEAGRWALVALTGAVSAGIAIWLWRVDSRRLAVALGLVLGGALGNLLDRLIFGAVADFFHFFAFGISFYVFNLADAAITVGVLILLWDALPSPKKANKTATNAEPTP